MSKGAVYGRKRAKKTLAVVICISLFLTGCSLSPFPASEATGEPIDAESLTPSPSAEPAPAPTYAPLFSPSLEVTAPAPLAIRESAWIAGALRIELYGAEEEYRGLLIDHISVSGAGGFQQDIELSGDDIAQLYDDESMFFIEDMNFDGMLDFRVARGLFAGGNLAFLVWIWDAGAEQFIRDDALSGIISPQFYSHERLILEQSADGSAHSITGLYAYVDGEPYKFFRRERVFEPERDREFLVQSIRYGDEWLELSREPAPTWNPVSPEAIEQARAIPPPREEPVATRYGILSGEPARIDACRSAWDRPVDTIIVTGTDGMWQTITLEIPSPLSDDHELYFVLEDLDFDNELDLRIVADLPSNYPYYYYWLWDARSKQFVRFEALDSLLGIEVCTNGLLFSYYKDNASDHSAYVYAWIDGMPVLVYSIRRIIDDFDRTYDYTLSIYDGDGMNERHITRMR